MTIANSFLFKISKPQQICFVVYDLEKWMERMWTVFGIRPWKVNVRDENSTKDNSVISDMVYMGKPAHFGYKLASALLETNLIIELLQPLSGDSIYSDFLKQHGERMQHIGWHMVYSYDEYLKVFKMLEENGFSCLQSAKTFASRIGYFDTTKVLGAILEVCDLFFLTYYSLVCIFKSFQSEFLVRQAKSGESSWLKSQPDKVSRPSEPSFASMRATVWVKRKQEDSRP